MSEDADSAREDEAWSAYPNTVLELPGGARVDLRRPVGEPERAALGRLGLGPRFALLTAENPCGESAEDAPPPERAPRETQNELRLSALERELERLGRAWRRVDGIAPDGSHRERLVAVAFTSEQAVGLAKRFDQLALFHFDGDRFWLLPAEADAAARPLP